MALNKYMHPRNLYKKKRPDFKKLAIKYADFRNHVTQDLAGKVHLDFKKPECLRALTCSLLRDDFGIELEIPLHRLIPTVPQRLNYILWIEDIIGDKKEQVFGIDIGTGASCIYPILGCRKNSWRFVATDVDELNLEYARKNVKANGMENKIQVLKVNEDNTLLTVVKDCEEDFDFCMCNPPFFSDHLEAQAVMTTKSVERPEPSGAASASDVESIAQGGEVEFVKKIMDDSLRLKKKIRVYTTLLGKKSSLGILKNELRKRQVHKYSCSEFCQGRTMRWALAWTFDPDVTFPKSLFQEGREKSKPPLVYPIPHSIEETENTIERLAAQVQKLLADLKMEYTTVISSEREYTFCAKATENTWSHQRRKRRQMEREKKLSGEDNSSSKIPKSELQSDCDLALGCHTTAGIFQNNGSEATDNSRIMSSAMKKDMESVEPKNATQHVNKNEPETTKTKETLIAIDVPHATTSDAVGSVPSSCHEINSTQTQSSAGTDKELIIRCFISLKKSEDVYNLEMKWIEGPSRDVMFQLMQFFKNKIK